MATETLMDYKQISAFIDFQPRVDLTMTLRDGRVLGYAQYGDPSGTPVFFFHGSAGSRLEHPANVCAIGARVVCVDRPGHGLSDFVEDRELTDWPDDVAQLADHLGIDRFYVLGWSAGGPHALVCAYQMPERVIAGSIAAGLGPMKRPGAMRGFSLAGRAFIFAAQNIPLLIGFLREMARQAMWNDAAKAKQRLLLELPRRERARMLSSGNLDMWLADVREGYRQGWEGVARDDVILMREWGFDISKIQVRIDIWHGNRDRNVPIQGSEYMHHRIPGSRATFLHGEGHLFLLNHWCRVVQDLIEGELDE